MVCPPGLATSFPVEYMDYIGCHPRDHAVGRSILYGSPLDPGERLGRQGDENFMTSVLIGIRESMHIILRYDGNAAAPEAAWHYSIVTSSETRVFIEFDTFAELLAYLRAERVKQVLHP